MIDCRSVEDMAPALSSRGLGRGPLKAQTRVRIPLALWELLAISHELLAVSFKGPPE